MEVFREAIRKMRKRSSLAEVLPERPSRTAIQHAAERQAVAPRATTQVGRRRHERIIRSPGGFKGPARDLSVRLRSKVKKVS